MVRKISIMNRKGGVGKTTITANLAATAAAVNNQDGSPKYKVLLIDLDPQGDCSQYLGLSQSFRNLSGEKTPDMGVVFRDGKPISDCLYKYNYKRWLPEKTKDALIGDYYDSKIKDYIKRPYKIVTKDNFDVAPAYEELDVETDVDDFLHEMKVDLIREKLREVEGDYDWIFLDCPPTWNKISQAAIAATEWYVVPIKPGEFERRGIETLLEKTAILNQEKGKELGFEARLLRVVMNGFQRNIRDHLTQAFECQEVLGSRFCQTMIPLSVDAIRSLKYNLPFAFFPEGGKGLLRITFETLLIELERAHKKALNPVISQEVAHD